MAESFHCPACGAPLDVPSDGSKSIRCPFCNETVVVPFFLLDQFSTKQPNHSASAAFPPTPTPPGYSPIGLTGFEKKISDVQPKVTRIFTLVVPLVILFIIFIAVVLILTLVNKP